MYPAIYSSNPAPYPSCPPPDLVKECNIPTTTMRDCLGFLRDFLRLMPEGNPKENLEENPGNPKLLW